MKKIVILMIVTSTLFLFCGKNTEKEIYVVGVNTNEIYPFELKGEKATGVTGFQKEFILEVAKKGNFEIEFVETPFSMLLSEIKDDNLDMGIGLITITNQRKKIVNFSRAYIKTDIVVLGNKEKKIENKENLIYGVTSGSYFKGLLKDKKITIVEEVDTSKIIENLIKQELDYVIIDKISWDKYLDRNSILYEKEILGNELIGIAFSKNLPKEFTNKIDNIILSMEKDGSLNNLKKKYEISVEK